MPLSPGKETPLVSMPESAKNGGETPGVVGGCPVAGICQAGLRAAKAVLVRVKAVELLPRTSTYQVPFVRNGGTMTAALGVEGMPAKKASLGRRSFRTRMVANPDNCATSSSQPSTGLPWTL